VRERKDAQQQISKADAFVHEDERWRSALEVVVENEINAFVDAMDQSVFQQLVNSKWNEFARRYHLYHEVVPYLTFVLVCTAATLYRVAAVWEMNMAQYYPADVERYYMLVPGTPEGYATAAHFLFYLLYVLGVPFLIYKAFQVYIHACRQAGMHTYMHT
jgi:hypothetical protein